MTLDELKMVSPALERHTRETLRGDLWAHPGLSPRDRGLVTVAALIARDQTRELPYYATLALEHGVTPGELSETITHLAFYSGWGSAVSAAAVVSDVLAERGVAFYAGWPNAFSAAGVAKDIIAARAN